MFIERVVNSDMHHIETRDSKVGKGALRTLAKEKGYDLVGQQIHWFKLTEGRTMPAGLEVVFDNEPPGHCTLTVSREMQVSEFMSLIAEHLGFEYIGTDVFGLN